MKTKLIYSSVSFALLCAVIGIGFMSLVYGPQTLIPPPNWPFTEDSRKQYDPLGKHSQLVVKTFADDANKGRLKF